MESLLSHDPNRDTPACFPCPDAPLSPPHSPGVLVAPGAPLRPARKRRIDDDLMKWIVEELGIYHLNVLRLRRERPAARAPGRARPAGQRVRQGRGIKVFGVIYARRAATSPSTAAPAIRVHLMRPPARRQACAALPRDVYAAKSARRDTAFKSEHRQFYHWARVATRRRRRRRHSCGRHS